MIEEDLSQKHLVFFFSDVKYDIMKAILDYMYIGEVHIQNDYLKDFIRVAEKLKIRGLVKDLQPATTDKDATDSSTSEIESDKQVQVDKRPRLESGSNSDPTRRPTSSSICAQDDVQVDEAATTEATTNALCSLLTGKASADQLQGIEVGRYLGLCKLSGLRESDYVYQVLKKKYLKIKRWVVVLRKFL